MSPDSIRRANAEWGAVAAPKTILLEFSEAIELTFSGVELTAGTSSVTVPKARFNGSDRKVLVTDLPALRPGNYRVPLMATAPKGTSLSASSRKSGNAERPKYAPR